MPPRHRAHRDAGLATLRNDLRLLIVAPFAATAIACEHLKPAYRLILGFKRKF